ncbi:hypothetical protein [Amycolatopsis saalfeldensis]|uniref:Uncharacterized protein n=1 Tax=Amycolatopsis saalfeldensis TaxID=394193 RepID=A0A1H8Y0M3_9PSEU|nr:hypothetical protein [Amycolatopsis saalfeldensis]SEP45592.1 hypothetical protein SAMN04489732_11076 [Amycolatopsis saalfeldensis]
MPLVEKATRQFLNEQVNDRLKNALGAPDSYTEEELEGYRVIRAIVCAEVPASRITARDNQTYFGVLLDNNNRKPIARLWFNRAAPSRTRRAARRRQGLLSRGQRDNRGETTTAGSRRLR